MPEHLRVGYCERISYPDEPTARALVLGEADATLVVATELPLTAVGPALMTTATFGCVLWEARADA